MSSALPSLFFLRSRCFSSHSHNHHLEWHSVFRRSLLVHLENGYFGRGFDQFCPQLHLYNPYVDNIYNASKVLAVGKHTPLSHSDCLSTITSTSQAVYCVRFVLSGNQPIYHRITIPLNILKIYPTIVHVSHLDIVALFDPVELFVRLFFMSKRFTVNKYLTEGYKSNFVRDLLLASWEISNNTPSLAVHGCFKYNIVLIKRRVCLTLTDNIDYGPSPAGVSRFSSSQTVQCVLVSCVLVYSGD